MENLRDESEKLLSSIESAMNKLRADRDVLEEDLSEARVQVQRAEDREHALRGHLARLQTGGKYQRMQMVWLLARYIAASKGARESTERAVTEAKQRIELVWRRNLNLVESELATQNGRLDQMLDMKAKLRESLVSHKRELLIEHKMSSATVQQQLAELSERKQELQR